MSLTKYDILINSRYSNTGRGNTGHGGSNIGGGGWVGPKGGTNQGYGRNAGYVAYCKRLLRSQNYVIVGRINWCEKAMRVLNILYLLLKQNWRWWICSPRQ